MQRKDRTGLFLADKPRGGERGIRREGEGIKGREREKEKQRERERAREWELESERGKEIRRGGSGRGRIKESGRGGKWATGREREEG